MTFLYVANVRFPTEKAHGIQIAKTAEAMAKAGLLEALWVTARRTAIAEPASTYYGLRQDIPMRRFRTLGTEGLGKIGFLASSLVFGLRVACALHPREGRMVYSRDELVLSVLSVCRRTPFVWETHTGSWNMAAQRVAKRADYIVAISEGLKAFYIEKGIPAGRILVAPDGVDLEAFEVAVSQEEARISLGLPLEARIVLYAGRLDGFKGAETLYEAAELLPDVLVVVVGGEPAQVREHAAAHPGIRFLGARPYRELPLVQKAADVLVIPNSGVDPVSARFTSPMKLFSYMASGVPIVASDLPSIREVLDDSSGTFFVPDDGHDLAVAIRTVLEDQGAAREKACQAREHAARYTWDARVASIASGIVH